MQQQTLTTVAPRARVLVVLLLLSGLLAVLLAGPASAHARFEGSEPAEGAALTELPATVVLSYSEAVAPEFVDTAVVPPGGDPVVTTAAAEGTDVTIDLGAADVVAAAGQAGTWQVVARVVSADGHPVEHTTSFDLQPAAAAPTPVTGPTEPTGPRGPATSSPAPVGDDPVAVVSEGLPGWVGVLAVLAVLAAGATALVAVLRRRPPEA